MYVFCYYLDNHNFLSSFPCLSILLGSSQPVNNSSCLYVIHISWTSVDSRFRLFPLFWQSSFYFMVSITYTYTNTYNLNLHSVYEIKPTIFIFLSLILLTKWSQFSSIFLKMLNFVSLWLSYGTYTQHSLVYIPHFFFSGRLWDGPLDWIVNSRHGCASISGVMIWEPEGFACFFLFRWLNPRLWWVP